MKAEYADKFEDESYRIGNFHYYSLVTELAMRVIAVKTLKQFWAGHPDATAGLKNWYERVSVAVYRNPAEVVADLKEPTT